MILSHPMWVILRIVVKVVPVHGAHTGERAFVTPKDIKLKSWVFSKSLLHPGAEGPAVLEVVPVQLLVEVNFERMECCTLQNALHGGQTCPYGGSNSSLT